MKTSEIIEQKIKDKGGELRSRQVEAILEFLDDFVFITEEKLERLQNIVNGLLDRE